MLNLGTITGGIVSECENAWSASVPRVRRVLFSIVARDSKGVETLWKCEAEGDDPWLDELVARGGNGSRVKLDFELAGRPFIKGDVRVGDVRFLRVRGVEFDWQGGAA